MFKTSILKSKIKRSNIDFENTFLFDSSNDDILDTLKYYPTVKLEDGEEIIANYIKSDDYKWVLTNHRIIFSNDLKNILLSDIIEVEAEKIKGNPDLKMINTELMLFANGEKKKIFVEERTWHLFYNVFRFIVNKNKLNPAVP